MSFGAGGAPVGLFSPVVGLLVPPNGLIDPSWAKPDFPPRMCPSVNVLFLSIVILHALGRNRFYDHFTMLFRKVEARHLVL